MTRSSAVRPTKRVSAHTARRGRRTRTGAVEHEDQVLAKRHARPEARHQDAEHAVLLLRRGRGQGRDHELLVERDLLGGVSVRARGRRGGGRTMSLMTA